jgi:hypothetical protein
MSILNIHPDFKEANKMNEHPRIEIRPVFIFGNPMFLGQKRPIILNALDYESEKILCAYESKRVSVSD